MKEDTNQPGLSWSSPKSSSPQAIPKPADSPVPQPIMTAVKTAAHPQAPVYAGLLVGGIIVGVLIASAWTSYNKPSVSGSGTATSTPAAANSASGTPQNSGSATAVPFSVADQSAGSSVTVTDLSIKTPTWVVVYVSRDGKPGNALGAKLFFAGDKQGKISLLRDTERGQTYFVGMRTDNGNRIFSLSTDKPVMGQDGSALWATLKAL